jgi:hypothetical protein
MIFFRTTNHSDANIPNDLHMDAADDVMPEAHTQTKNFEVQTDELKVIDHCSDEMDNMFEDISIKIDQTHVPPPPDSPIKPKVSDQLFNFALSICTSYQHDSLKICIPFPKNRNTQWKPMVT